MFEPAQIRRAVDLQVRSYALLRWMADAIRRGLISFDAAHSYATFPEAAQAWVRSHYADLPAAARPHHDDVVAFCRLFATYVDSTFELVRDPGKRLYSPDAHCFCPMCSWLVDVPQLQPKRLGASDRRQADRLKIAALHALAAERGRSLSDDDAETLVAIPAMREDVALVAYGRDLLDRLGGSGAGAASLALWRGFAWTAEGSPRKRFALSAEAMLEAEQRVLTRVLAGAESA